MADAITILKTFGPWLGILLLIGLFIWRKAWPWATEWIEKRTAIKDAIKRKEQEFWQAQFTRMTSREDQIIKEMTTAIRENTAQSQLMGQHIETLTQAVREPRRAK